MKAKLIFIEGTDRVGKGSLMTAIHKATNYKHVIFDRGPISNKVYSEVNGRLTSELQFEYSSLEQSLADAGGIVLYLYCDIDELEKRRKDTNHEEVEFAYHQELFAGYMKTTPLKVYPIDTTVMTPDTIAQMLVDTKII